MGHTKQETTRNYFEVNLPEIAEGTKRVILGQWAFDKAWDYSLPERYRLGVSCFEKITDIYKI